MAFKKVLIGNILFVRWGEAVEQPDISGLVEACTAAYEAKQAPITYVGIIPTTTRPLDSSMRRLFMEGLTSLGERLEAIHMVVEGEGLRAGLVRNILAGMLLLNRSFGRRLSVHGTLPEVISALVGRGQLDTVEMLEVLKAEAVAG